MSQEMKAAVSLAHVFSIPLPPTLRSPSAVFRRISTHCLVPIYVFGTDEEIRTCVLRCHLDSFVLAITQEHVTNNAVLSSSAHVNQLRLQLAVLHHPLMVKNIEWECFFWRHVKLCGLVQKPTEVQRDLVL